MIWVYIKHKIGDYFLWRNDQKYKKQILRLNPYDSEQHRALLLKFTEEAHRLIRKYHWSYTYKLSQDIKDGKYDL